MSGVWHDRQRVHVLQTLIDSVAADAASVCQRLENRSTGLTDEEAAKRLGESKGAIRMSRERVIVKRLNAIQNLGAMDVLCTDKTGTLTLDRVILERHCDVALKESEEVLALAYMNSHFQTGLKTCWTARSSRIPKPTRTHRFRNT